MSLTFHLFSLHAKSIAKDKTVDQFIESFYRDLPVILLKAEGDIDRWLYGLMASVLMAALHSGRTFRSAEEVAEYLLREAEARHNYYLQEAADHAKSTRA